MQVITAMFVGLVNVVLIARCQPYCGHAREEGDLEDAKKNVGVVNSFAMQSVLMVFLSLFGALLGKFDSGFASTGAVEAGYSYEVLQWFLIGTAAFVGVFGLAIVTKEAGDSGFFDVLYRFLTSEKNGDADPFEGLNDATKVGEALDDCAEADMQPPRNARLVI
jgi:hypothetical protein